MRKNVAVILASGKGSRLGYKNPKQFLKIAGKLVIEHTIEAFQKHKLIDEIAIVCHKDYVTLVEDIVNKRKYFKVKKILIGGKERSDSSLAAIRAYDGEDVNLIFHDAVRPLVSDRIISDCINALRTYNAVDVTIPATDTIIEVDKNFIINVPDRSKLKRGQTPQAFKIETIKKAYELGLKDPFFKTTDDCGVVRKYLPNEKIYVVTGDIFNMKITYEPDLFLIEKLFQLKRRTMLDKSTSFNLLKDKVMVIFGGSSGIGYEMKKIAEKYKCKVYSFSRSQTNTNIAIKEDVIKAFDTVLSKENKIDFVVNTAAILNKEPLVNMDYKTIENAIATNYLGAVIIAKESFIPLSKSKGSLLLFTSSSYTRGRANYSIYSSSKAAIVNFTQAIDSEWEPFGIRVNCINPERTITPMRIKNFGNEDPRTLLKAEDVAKIALQTLLLPISGEIIDVKIDKNE